MGAPDLYDGDEYYHAFESYSDALEFSESTPGTKAPLALIQQDEYIDEPESGQYVHVRKARITEWPVEFLKHPRRDERTIPDFLAAAHVESRRRLNRGPRVRAADHCRNSDASCSRARAE